MIIYYNPECSKCKEAVSLLEAEHCQFEIRNYLEIPPTEIELRELLTLLRCNAETLVRKSDAFFLEKYGHQNLSDANYFQILLEEPVLLQRPIVIDGSKAVIGRPPNLVLDLVKK